LIGRGRSERIGLFADAVLAIFRAPLMIGKFGFRGVRPFIMKLRSVTLALLGATFFLAPGLVAKPKHKHPPASNDAPPDASAPIPAATPAPPAATPPPPPAATPPATPVPVNGHPFGSVAGQIDREVIEMVRDPKRARIYATTTLNTVAVIDTKTLALEQEIEVGSQPRGLDVSADGTKLYVANSGATVDGISIVDLKTLAVVRRLDTTEPPVEVVAGIAAKLFILTHKGLQQVSEETGDLQADSAVRAVRPVAPAPARPAPPTPAPALRSALFIPGSPMDSASFLPVALAAPRAEVAPMDVSVYGGMIRLSPDRRTLYYGNTGLSPNTLYAIDVSERKPSVREKISLGSNGQDLIINPNGESLCYPSGSGNHNYDIALLPARDLKGQLASFPVGAYPKNGAFSADGKWFYTAPSSQPEVQVYDVAKGLQKLSFKRPRPATDIGRLLCDGAGDFLFAAPGPALRKEERKPLVVFAIRR
jgi:YVTN family beta-propeller protein